MVYVGIDLHRKKTQMAMVNEAGELLANRAVVTEGMEIMRVFGEVAPRPTPISVAFEATSAGGGSPTCCRTPAWRCTCRTP
jgi:hypothetical protein